MKHILCCVKHVSTFQTRQTLSKLQLTVSSDARFRNLRDTLRRSEPPCIPYLGMYLSDLTFIEEGTLNFTEDGLLNFSKMRMVCKNLRIKYYFQLCFTLYKKVSGIKQAHNLSLKDSKFDN